MLRRHKQWVAPGKTSMRRETWLNQSRIRTRDILRLYRYETIQLKRANKILIGTTPSGAEFIESVLAWSNMRWVTSWQIFSWSTWMRTKCAGNTCLLQCGQSSNQDVIFYVSLNHIIYLFSLLISFLVVVVVEIVAQSMSRNGITQIMNSFKL